MSSSHVSESSAEGKQYKRIMEKMQEKAPKRDKYDIGTPKVEVTDGSGKKIEAIKIEID